MYEKPPKDPAKKGQVVDIKTRKIIPNPQETLELKLPEISTEEAKKIFQDIFDDFEPKVWHLHGLVKKAREKFDAYEHLATSPEYSEGDYRALVSQKKPHRMGDKVGREKEISRIFSDEDAQLFGKIYEYEREFKDYIENFLMKRGDMERELDKAYSHLKNIKGAEGSKEKLEKYLEKVAFDCTTFILTKNNLDGYRKKVEALEEFTKKLIN